MAVYDPFYIKIWKICLPRIIITSPRADVCARCEPNKRALEDAVTDQARVHAVKDHIKKGGGVYGKGSVRSTQKSCYIVRRHQCLPLKGPVLIKKQET